MKTVSKQSLFVMCGISCSGKSTTATKLHETTGAELVSTDMHRKKSDFNKISLNRNPLERYVVYHHALKKAEELLLKGKDVVVDGTFILRVLRQAAYYVAYTTGSTAYLIHCVCNNYGLIERRYERRKKNNSMFEAWAKIEGHNAKYQQFESIDREVMPDGRPVPVIVNDTEKEKAEITYSDGSRTIEELVGVLNTEAKLKTVEITAHG